MIYYDKLTTKRKAFIDQLYNLINTQFEEQEELKRLEASQIIEELENNSDYIQRIFIDAPWGMGKSFFSKALKEKIEKENEDKKKAGIKKIELININAWETDYFSDSMKSLIGEIDNSVGLSDHIKEEVKNFLSRGFQTLKKIGWKEVFGFIGEAGLNKVLDKAGITEEKRKEIIDAYNETNEINTDELEEYKKYKELITKFKIALSKDEKLKVIVIDELDRCKPTYAIELLETIKHFFGVKNIIFVFLVNKKQLQSIVSTSYLQDDECSEYFEKFFDIQFNLPELEYEDFLQIEYDSYNQVETYRVDERNISEDTIKIYESIFLEAFNSNCDSSTVSPRKFIKSFKKFRVLLTSLSDEERACYPLMIVLILYFIREEFLRERRNINADITGIELLFCRTFFRFANNSKINKASVDTVFINSIHLKRNFISQNKFFDKFYFDFYFTLFYKNGFEKNESTSTSYSKKKIYILDIESIQNSNIENYPLKYKIQSNNIIYKNIYIYIKREMKFKIYSELSKSQNSPVLQEEEHPYVVVDFKYFENSNISKYKLSFFETESSFYHTDILLEWAKQKYNFIMNIK